MKGALRSAQIQTEQIERLPLLPGYVQVGRAKIELPSEPHVAVLLAWARSQDRRVLEAAAILDLQVPRRAEDCALALRGLASLEDDIERLRQELREHEKPLDELVCDYYEVSPDLRTVVAECLARF